MFCDLFFPMRIDLSVCLFQKNHHFLRDAVTILSLVSNLNFKIDLILIYPDLLLFSS